MLLPALLLLAACAGAPPALTGSASDFARLDGGGSVYFVATMPDAWPLLRALSGGEGFAGLPADGLPEEISGRISHAAGAFYGTDRARGRSFHIIAWGNFPAVRARFGLGASRDWRIAKSSTGREYWRYTPRYSPRSVPRDQAPISLALGAHQAIISDADPFAFSAPVTPPPSFPPVASGAALAFWLREPGAALDPLLATFGLPLRIPAENLFFAFHPADPPQSATVAPWYRVLLRLEFPEEPQAQALASLLNLARRNLSPVSGSAPPSFTTLLLSTPPEREGRALVFHGAPLPPDQAAALLASFPLRN